MSVWHALEIVVGIVIAVVIGWFATHAAWRVRGAWRIRRAGPRWLMSTRHRLWRQPSTDDLSDLRFGPGGEKGQPVPPFAFDEELLSGTQPTIAVRDRLGRRWRVKWGQEARPEAFAVRFAHACGYFAEVTHYVANGRIEGCAALTRASGCVQADGTFADARFELEDRDVRMLFDEHSWAWNDNPFVGTRELSGLKIVVMLLSNWDTKDLRDVARGSNTGIFECRVGAFGREARYLITDWGAAMGKWGATVVSRGRWDVGGFEAQTPSFVTGVTDGWVDFAYQGQRSGEIGRGISVDHVRWFYGFAARIPERAIREALTRCGATPEEASGFAAALRARIDQLGAIANAGSAAA